MNVKQKGTRIEREIAQRHIDAGIQCRRVPYSGAVGTLFPKFTVMKGDVQILNGEFVAEVKARANGDDFKTLGRRLAEYDVLFLRRHRQSPLVVLPWDVYLRLRYSLRCLHEICGRISANT